MVPLFIDHDVTDIISQGLLDHFTEVDLARAGKSASRKPKTQSCSAGLSRAAGLWSPATLEQ